MQPFYLSKNSSGFYKAYFVNTETGKVIATKSTHSTNKFEATQIASNWHLNGLPSARTTSCSNYKNNSALTSGMDLQSIVNRLTRDEALELNAMITARFSFIPCGDVVNEKAVVQMPAGAAAVIETGFADTEALSSVPKSDNANPSEPIFLIEALTNFWDFENSEYVKKRQLRGFDIKQRNCKEKLGIVRRYWATYFDADRTVQSLTSRELDEFLLSLRRDRGLSADTVNKTMTAGNMAFEFLIKEGRLEKNPLSGVERFRVQSRKRGIPTETEMKQLMDLDWNWTDSVYKLAFKVAAFYGLRAGEISGLRVCDIDVVGDMLHVRHSFSEMDGLKTTKNKEVRDLPIEHSIALQLMNQARRNPEFGDLSYVFWSVKNHKMPITPGYYGDCFYKALEEIGVSELVRKERNIVFHSLRHFCCTMLKQKADKEIVMQIMGHKSFTMTDHYSDHETQEKFENMRTVISSAWEKYLTA